MDVPWQGITTDWTSMNSSRGHYADILEMVSYLLLVLGVGLWALLSNSRGTVEEFFLAGRNLAWWLIGASLFASDVGPTHFVGLAGTGAASGIAVVAFEWNSPFMLCLLGWIFSPIYIKAGVPCSTKPELVTLHLVFLGHSYHRLHLCYIQHSVVTTPEYLRKRFGGYRIHFLLAVLYLFLCFFHKISVEICTGAMFMKMIWGLDVYLATAVLLTITGIYMITGGFIAVVYTNALHAVFTLLGSLVLTGYAFKEVGGYQGLQHSYLNAKPSIVQEGNWTAKPQCYLPRPDSFHIFRHPVTGDLPWPGVVLGIPILSLYYWCTDQVFVQRCLAGRSMSHVKGGCVFCGYLKLLPMFSIVMPGMISRVLYTDKVACITPSECRKHCGTLTTCSLIAYPLLIVELLPRGVRGLMLSAMWASLMSTLSSVFNSASTLFTVDIYTRIRPMATERELMVTGRFFVIILLAVTVTWIPIIQTIHSERLFEYMQAVRSYLVPPISATFVLAIFCKRVTEQGAFWGLAGGFLIGFIRMVSEFAYGRSTCLANSKCPRFICGIHYLYFSIFLFILTVVIVLGISLVTDPIPDKHLHRLCWSLRNSQEERVDLDAAMQGKRIALRTQPELLRESRACFWKALDIICGLEPIPGSRLIPEKVTMEKMKEHGATSEETVHCNKLESPFWRKVIDISALLLLLVTVLCHILYH